MKKILYILALAGITQQAAAQRVVNINVTPLPSATLSGNTTVCTGEQAVLSVILTGTLPGTFTLNDGVKDQHIMVDQAATTINVTPGQTTTYKIVKVIDALCAGTTMGNPVIVKVNQPPTDQGIDSTINQNAILGFSEKDFKSNYFDHENNTFSGIKITFLPNHGILTLNGQPVTINQILTLDEIAKLIFIPEENQTGEPYDVFRFKVFDGTCYSTVDYDYIINVKLSKITLTNTFSPNGDNINEYLVFPGLENYPDNDIVIFNRWGNEVFKKKGYKNDWDGTMNGSTQKLPTGTYFYILNPGNGDPVTQGYIYLTY
jgi:gliding motility-associated-like protein